jgi:hypothetical protein
VVVPVTGRADPLDELYRELRSALDETAGQVEYLFLFRPEDAERATALETLRATGEPIRVLRLAQPAGLAALTRAGATQAHHDTILILPPHRRVEGAVLPELVARVRSGADAAFAARSPERERLSQRIHRRLFHFFARPITRGVLRDLGSGVGAVRRDALLATPAYGDFFRFLPALMLREGFQVIEVPAVRHPGDARPGLYPFGTYLRNLVDLLGMLFLARFTERPLRFFGLVGVVLAVPGAITLVVLLIQRLEGVGIANRPALLLGTLLLVLGVQAIALGLVAEIIVYLSASTRRSYRLARPAGEGASAADAAE